MKINSPLEQKFIRGLHCTLLVGTLGLSSYCLMDTVSQENIKNKKARSYVQNHDIDRYYDLVVKETYSNIVNWQEEAQKIETALKIDSAAKTNYTLGLQAAKDSLININKK